MPRRLLHVVAAFTLICSGHALADEILSRAGRPTSRSPNRIRGEQEFPLERLTKPPVAIVGQQFAPIQFIFRDKSGRPTRNVTLTLTVQLPVVIGSKSPYGYFAPGARPQMEITTDGSGRAEITQLWANTVAGDWLLLVNLSDDPLGEISPVYCLNLTNQQAKIESPLEKLEKVVAALAPVAAVAAAALMSGGHQPSRSENNRDRDAPFLLIQFQGGPIISSPRGGNKP